MPKTEIFDRATVLQNASDVFHYKGYNATSMQDLVDATGLNRSSIYNSFGSKHNLFLECLKAYESKNNKFLLSMMLNADNAYVAIERVFRAALQDALKDKDKKGCLIVNCKSEMANQDAAIHHFLINNQSHTLELFTGLVAKGQSNGILNTNKTTEAYALYLYTALQGFRATSMLLNDKEQLQGLIQITLGALK